MVITSDLTRAIQSAKYLNPKVKPISDHLFRETELPFLTMKTFDIKLRPSIWAIIMRILWFCGYSNDCESLSNAKLRAKKASQKLIDYAEKNKSIVLVGHVFFNMLIAKELKKKGWKGKQITGSKHWNCTTYVLNY